MWKLTSNCLTSSAVLGPFFGNVHISRKHSCFCPCVDVSDASSFVLPDVQRVRFYDRCVLYMQCIVLKYLIKCVFQYYTNKPGSDCRGKAGGHIDTQILIPCCFFNNNVHSYL